MKTEKIELANGQYRDIEVTTPEEVLQQNRDIMQSVMHETIYDVLLCANLRLVAETGDEYELAITILTALNQLHQLVADKPAPNPPPRSANGLEAHD